MKVLIIAATLLLSSMAFADPYVGLTATSIDTGVTDHAGINVSLGVQVNEFIGVETRTLLSSSEEYYDGARVEIDSLIGFYTTFTLPVSNWADSYFIVGRTYAEVSASYGGYSASAEDDFTSVGFGIKYDISDDLIFTSEYMDMDGADSLSFGVQFNL